MQKAIDLGKMQGPIAGCNPIVDNTDRRAMRKFATVSNGMGLPGSYPVKVP